MAETLGVDNPFRYRGYYYDTETGFYYLNSRYYDPEVGRFINADGYVQTPNGDATSTNMFAYCKNNAVNAIDSTGMWAVGIGLNANATAFFGVLIGIGIMFDDKGNFEVQWSYACPGVNNTTSIGALDAGVSLGVQFLDVNSVADTHGYSTYSGASGGYLGYGGIDVVSLSKFSDFENERGGVQVSVGLGIGADVHTTQTYTQPIWSNKKSTIVKKPVVQNNTNFSQSLQINTTLYKKLSLMEKRLGR